MTFEELYDIVKNRQLKKSKNSYTASLLQQGKDKIIQKVGEEAIEVLIAAKNSSQKEIIYEVSDLVYHLLVMLASFDISLTDIDQQLEKRRR